MSKESDGEESAPSDKVDLMAIALMADRVPQGTYENIVYLLWQNCICELIQKIASCTDDPREGVCGAMKFRCLGYADQKPIAERLGLPFNAFSAMLMRSRTVMRASLPPPPRGAKAPEPDLSG